MLNNFKFEKITLIVYAENDDLTKTNPDILTSLLDALCTYETNFVVIGYEKEDLKLMTKNDYDYLQNALEISGIDRA